MNTDTGDIYRNPQAIEDARARGEPIVEVSELVARKMDLANEVKRLADEIERLQPPSPIDTSHGDLLREIAKLPGHSSKWRLRRCTAMTNDLTARIEAAARELDTRIHNEIASVSTHSRKLLRAMFRVALTALAEQIVSEKDAEAAGLQAKLDASDANWKAIVEKLVHDNGREYQRGMIDAEKAGKAKLAEAEVGVAAMRDRVKELEGRIERYENSGRV